jgi:hypothetical protein
VPSWLGRKGDRLSRTATTALFLYSELAENRYDPAVPTAESSYRTWAAENQRTLFEALMEQGSWGANRKRASMQKNWLTYHAAHQGNVTDGTMVSLICRAGPGYHE